MSIDSPATLLAIDQELELLIYALAYGGEGIAKHKGMVIFVANTFTGDQVRVRIQQVKKKFARARLVRLLQPSPERVDSVCPQSGTCGGCSWLNLNYPAQLKAKHSFVANTLSHVGRLKSVCVLPPIKSTPSLGYRHKIQIPVQTCGQALQAGFYARQTHTVVPFEECPVQPALGNRILKQTLILARTFGYTGYDETQHQGQLRHLVIRLGAKTKEAMLILVTTTPDIPRVREFAEAIRRVIPELVGVVQNINAEVTNVIMGPQYKILAGRAFLHEEIHGLKYRISAESFFQVNPYQMPVLAETVIQAAALTMRDTVVDLFCGVGFLSLELAKQAKRVFGIESTLKAIEDAHANKHLNGITNVDFYAQDAAQGLRQLWRKGVQPDLIVLDPPRKGCTPDMLQQLLECRSKKMVYVSCNPVTLARDLAGLIQGGYQVKEVQPVDMFPHTYHVESVVGLVRKIP
ncbi:23S rRNA (uracil(1939)-C(5))-methyltransferase RlmD [bacterium]|nr:23S rRNA (uracil(1939)-C(5))-methyltransferase RlmD [bacterium]